ncbi:MAG TPA: glycoside hydrolase family 25 protein [Thermoanaerobaculia bacterium]|jgi:GH25 family lysozyme M1 (1,4-beta-N-acetylmuramidase)
MTTISFHVVDLYHNDNVTSFADAAAAGTWGIIHKATTGGTGTDPAYAGRRQQALDAGLLWGAYHWGTAHTPVSDQIDNFLNIAQPDANTLLALDYEETDGNQMTLDQAREFLTLLYEQLGRQAVLYSGGLVKQQLGNKVDPFFGSHRLWLAQYGTLSPKVQKSWKKYWLWQYTDSTTGTQPSSMAGIPGDADGNLDCNSYLGTREQLAAEWAS